MKLYAVYNNEHIKLKEQFEKSLKDDYELHIIKIPHKTDNFRTPRFNLICMRKFEIIAESIPHNLGDIIIISDLDIQFFKETNNIIRTLIKNHDIISQMNNYPLKKDDERKPHIGFMAIKCNIITYNLFNEVVNIMRKHPEKQDMMVINQLLLTEFKDLKLGYFPPTVWHQRYSEKPPKDIILHHAIQWKEKNGQDKNNRIKLKLEQLSKIKNEVNNIN